MKTVTVRTIRREEGTLPQLVPHSPVATSATPATYTHHRFWRSTFFAPRNLPRVLRYSVPAHRPSAPPPHLCTAFYAARCASAQRLPGPASDCTHHARMSWCENVTMTVRWRYTMSHQTLPGRRWDFPRQLLVGRGALLHITHNHTSTTAFFDAAPLPNTLVFQHQPPPAA